MITAIAFHEGAEDLAGAIPYFLDVNDPRPAREQLDANYQHGGGWRPIPGFTQGRGLKLIFPDDPPFRPALMMMVHDEAVVIYEAGIVAIFKRGADGMPELVEVARMD